MGIESDNQQRVTVSAKMIFFFYGCIVSVHYHIISAKSGYEHKHGGLRHLEIGYERIGNAKIIGREDELVGPTIKGFNFLLCGHRSFNGP